LPILDPSTRRITLFLFVRIPIAVVSLLFLTFCIFGFFATFEPPGSVAWRVGYIIVGVGCAAAASWALVARRSDQYLRP
jgi:hypothetical protein